MLDGSSLADYDTTAPEWFASALGAWVRSDDYVAAAADTATADTREAGGAAIVGRWIVRLTPEAASEAGSVQRVEAFLDDVTVDFRVLRGLGLPGQVLAETDSPEEQIRAVLAANPNVTYFGPDSIVASQDTLPLVLPDDPFFSDLTNLHNLGQFGSSLGADIDAPEAWAMDNGSPNVVVGVVDSGVDLAHPDLYLNIWINQGEIPPAVRDQVVPTDDDELITFYDLNDPNEKGDAALFRPAS